MGISRARMMCGGFDFVYRCDQALQKTIRGVAYLNMVKIGEREREREREETKLR